jgi:hypothetical protein
MLDASAAFFNRGFITDDLVQMWAAEQAPRLVKRSLQT